MITEEIRQKIRRIKLHTTRVMQTTLSGDYASAFKGSGLEFDQLREYQPGDDVRSIDWNSSAKMNRLMIKEFIEERDRTIVLCIDVSASRFFGSNKLLRHELIAQTAAALTFIAHQHKDKVGALFFSDRIEAWLHPQRNSVQMGKILETIFSLNPQSKQTNPDIALKFLINLKKRNATVFFLSDWIFKTLNHEKLLRVLSIEYDFVALRFLDEREKDFVDVGLIELEDSETGKLLTIDSRAKNSNGLTIGDVLKTRCVQQNRMFDRYKIDHVDIPLHDDFFLPLARYFHTRVKRHI